MKNQKKIKYGFGMSPVSDKISQERIVASRAVKKFLESGIVEGDVLNHLSVVKGLFTRIYKQDQWDWFLTFESMGRVGRKKSIQFSSYLKFIRNEIKKGDFETTRAFNNKARGGLIETLGTYPVETPVDAEQIYILSTRENRDVLKIGFTSRSVTARVHEINSATGVLVPFGVRAVWRVRNAKDCERDIHELFAEERIRIDREFFRLDFRDAFNRINNFLAQRRKLEEM